MRQLFKTTYISVGILVLSISLSCKKQEAVPGPQGDQGVAGDTGNVVISDATFSATSWTLVNNGWESTYKTAKITNKVVVAGEVEVYMKKDDHWWSLPYAEGDIFMQATFELQTLHLKYFKIHAGPPARPDTVTFRMVVLEPVD